LDWIGLPQEIQIRRLSLFVSPEIHSVKNGNVNNRGYLVTKFSVKKMTVQN